jgi:hypothetical protein
VHVDVPPERLWSFVVDITLPARFSAEFKGATWLGGVANASLGARFVGRNANPIIGSWETISTVVELEPFRAFGWAVNDPDYPSASWRFSLEPEAEGTWLRQWARLGPGPSGLTPAIAAMPDKEERIVARRLEDLSRNMTATVEGLKSLAEADPDDSCAAE